MVKTLAYNYLAAALVDIALLHSVALCCVTKLHILELCFIVPSTRCTCVIIRFLICHICLVDRLSWQRRNAL
jgi:hypothetical protein